MSGPTGLPVPGGSAPRPGPPGGPAGPRPGPPPAAGPPPEVDGAESEPEVVGALAASTAALDELADLPVAEHVARYDALHGELSEALAAIDGV